MCSYPCVSWARVRGVRHFSNKFPPLQNHQSLRFRHQLLPQNKSDSHGSELPATKIKVEMEEVRELEKKEWNIPPYHGTARIRNLPPIPIVEIKEWCEGLLSKFGKEPITITFFCRSSLSETPRIKIIRGKRETQVVSTWKFGPIPSLDGIGFLVTSKRFPTSSSRF